MALQGSMMILNHGAGLFPLLWGRVDADDLALHFFSLRSFDLRLVAVDVVLHLGAYDEVGGVHGVVGSVRQV